MKNSMQHIREKGILYEFKDVAIAHILEEENGNVLAVFDYSPFFDDAYTLDVSVLENSSENNGWNVYGEVHEEYYEWVNEFTANKGKMWVKGDFEKIVEASSLEALENFLTFIQPHLWDYCDNLERY